jgi:hypothetical protein
MNACRAAVMLAVILSSGGAAAAEFIVVEDECRGRQMLIQGVIESGDYDRFLQQMQRLVAGDPLPDVQDPDVLWTVKLDSPGGDLDEAMRMGRFLRSALAITEVGYRYARRLDGVYDYARSGDLLCLEGEGRLAGCAGSLVEAECTGACLLIWLGGVERYALEGKLGQHGLAGSDAKIRDYLEDMQVVRPWMDRLGREVDAAAPWLTFAERGELGGGSRDLDGALSQCPAPPTADESFRSVAGASAAERDRLMDQAAAHRQCRHQAIARIRAARALFGP